MISYLNGYILYPILEKLTKRQIAVKLRELTLFETLSYEKKLEIQKEELYKLLVFCQGHIPFYQEMFKQNNFDIEKIKEDISYIKNLPVLTKEIVRDNAEKLKYLGNGLHARKTGGSTGQSVFFFYDNGGLDWTAAINLYAYNQVGKRPHHTDCHISAELGIKPPLLKYKVMQFFKLMSQNRKVLMIDSFSNEALKLVYKNLKSFKPYLLQGHPSTAYALASFIESNKLKRKKMFSVFEPTGEMITGKMIKTIEENLLCKVVNRYGNAEFGVIAHSTESHDPFRLKVFDRAFFVEETEESNIIVTGITNYGFPLLRYDTGDIGSVKKESDGTFIYNIQGRVHDLVEINGESFPTHFIMDFLDHKVCGVRQFQIVLTDSNKAILNIVPENEADSERIRMMVEKRWPDGFDIKFVGFEQLETQGWRNKFRFVINKRNIHAQSSF